MIKIAQKIGTTLIVGLLFTSVAFAQNTGTGGANTGSRNDPPAKLENPIGVNSINELVNTLVDIAFQIGAVVAVVMIIYSGFKFVMARGNESELGEAKKIFFYTIVGIAVLFGARVLAEIIKATVDSLNNY